MTINSVIDSAVESIRAIDFRRKILTRQLEPFFSKNFESENVLEKQLILPVTSMELSGKICGIDSGFVGKNLYSVDLMLIRAVGAIFSYNKGKLLKAEYFPNIYSFPMPYLSNNSMEKDEFELSTSLMRLMEEIDTAIQVIEKYSPQYCFLDGSIVPQYADKPRNDSEVKTAYHHLLEKFQNLYSIAEKNNCQLIACIEDSRGHRFRDILAEEVLKQHETNGFQVHHETDNSMVKNSIDSNGLLNCFDSILLDYILKPAQRTFAFKYTASIKEHPILMDFKKEWSEQVHAFYLKSTPYDRPLRVEFLTSKKGEELAKHVNQLASIVFTLSSLHKEYAFPSILIEADLRARLTPDEIEIVFNKIFDKLGKQLKLRLRRESRPF